jgi:Family of unknown function (DUF6334)
MRFHRLRVDQVPLGPGVCKNMGMNSENASVFFPRLSIFQSISNLPLISVSEKSSEGRPEEMVLDFGETCLIITANEEEDSLEVRAAQRPDTAGFVNVSESEPWTRFVGKRFGWGWLTINQLGAWDGLMLGFEAAAPQIMLHVTDSSIRVGVIG